MTSDPFTAVLRVLAGKSTFLQTLAAREVPLPAHIDTYLLTHEAEPCEMSALDYVIDRCAAARRHMKPLALRSDQLVRRIPVCAVIQTCALANS